MGGAAAGPGVEIVLDAGGCIVRSTPTRGVALAADQTSLQATGGDAAALVAVAGQGCVEHAETLTGADGEEVALRPGLFGVNGRNRLVAGGETVAPAGTGGSDGRNPRTIAGTTADGAIPVGLLTGVRMTTPELVLAADYAAQINPSFRVVDQGYVDEVHALGMHMSVYTVNAGRDMQAMLDLGVDGIITDVPTVLLDLLRRR